MGNAVSAMGGGVCCLGGGTPTFAWCLIGENSATQGGGVLLTNEAILTDCLITANSADHAGGGAVLNGAGAVSGCTFSENSAPWGSGVYCDDDSPTMVDCVISGNRGDNGGGEGIRFEECTATLTDCIIENNEGTGLICDDVSGVFSGCVIATNGGGGVSCDESAPELRECMISSNREYGVNFWQSRGQLVNCIISGNQGLGVVSRQSCGDSDGFVTGPNLVNSTITGNEYGVIAVCLCSVSLSNCIVWGNVRGSLVLGEGTDLGQADVSYSLIEGDDVWPGDGNLNGDPKFKQAGHWVSAGIPDDIRDDAWVDGDYHLESDSPCISAGTREGAPATDIEGAPRPCGAGVDMGAYEFGGCPTVTMQFVRGDANIDNNLDIADAVFTLRYLFADGPALLCMDAADADDDGALDIADAIAVLSHLFARSGDLPQPFGVCGVDPTADELGCSSFPPCQ